MTPASRAYASEKSKAYHKFIEQPENQYWLKPTFDLFNHLLDTKDNHKQLPIKGLENIGTFLLFGVLMLQLAMILNNAWGLPLHNISQMLAVLT